jgi:hypothetical protein
LLYFLYLKDNLLPPMVATPVVAMSAFAVIGPPPGAHPVGVVDPQRPVKQGSMRTNSFLIKVKFKRD